MTDAIPNNTEEQTTQERLDEAKGYEAARGATFHRPTTESKTMTATKPKLDIGTARRHFEGWGTLTKARLLTGDSSYVPPSTTEGTGGAAHRGSPSDPTDLILVGAQVQKFLESCKEAQRDVAYHTWVVGMRELSQVRYAFNDGSGFTEWMPAPLTPSERAEYERRGEPVPESDLLPTYGDAERRDETYFDPDWRDLQSPALDSYAAAFGLRRHTAIKREAQRLLTAYAQETKLYV